MIKEVPRNKLELSILSEWKLIILLHGASNPGEINYYFKKNNRDLRETHAKSLNEMEELKRFQGSAFDGFARRKLVEDRDTILELTGKIQELQNEVNCINDSRVFKDAESVRSGSSHVPSQPALFPSYRDPGGLLSHNNQPPDIWNTQGTLGNVFANPRASFSAPYPQGFNPWISNVSEHTSPHVMSEGQNPDTTLDLRCQLGPSARNSFDPQGGKILKELWSRPTTTADLGTAL